MKMTEAKVGQRVQFKPAGKCARLEGMSGKLVQATITALHPEENAVSLMADYRMLEGATFKGMGSFVEVKKLKAI